MKLNTDQLARALQGPLTPAWLVAGDEPLLVAEACDAIRARAREEGYTVRELFSIERSFDWSQPLASSQALSLFGDRRLIELRMPSPRPGKEGGAALEQLLTRPAPDTLLLVVTGRIEREIYATGWFKAFEAGGVVVQSWPVEIARLPQWIATRARRHGLELDSDGARLLAERVEGNLLAAHQEIEKLALLHPGGAVSAEQVATAVANSARYDVFQLGEAALDGDAPRSLRILEGLRGEGAEPTLVLWSLCRELRALAESRSQGGGKPAWGRNAERRAALLRRALERHAGAPLGPLFERAGRVDRRIKGLDRGDAWAGLEGLVAALGSVSLPDSAADGTLMRPHGVFGGMFDPIHYGHLRTAFELLETLDLESLAFLPAGEPPHREAPAADASTRLAMVRAAIADEPRLVADDRELGRAGPSWTVLTLTELRAERGDQALALIVGMDAYAGLGEWRRAGELIGLAHIVIAARPGTTPPSRGLAADWLASRRCEDPATLASRPAGLVYVHEGTQLDVSSSEVRRVVAEGRDPRYLMPEAARRIILATGSYACRGDAAG